MKKKRLLQLLLLGLALGQAAGVSMAQEEDTEAKLFRVPTDPDAELRAKNALELAVQEKVVANR